MPDNRPDPDPIGALADVQTRTEFFAALARLHEESGKTYREAARNTGLTFQTVNGYMRGKHLPHSRGRGADMFRRLLRIGYGVDDEGLLAAWTAALRRVADTPGPRAGAETVPYPGLRPFQPDEADWFFGRDDLVARLRAAVEAGTAGGARRTVLLTGASGSGKSSLVNIGVVAAASDGRFDTWRIARTTPGPDPVGALGDALKDDTRPCLLVVDQMEELWADGIDADQRRRFLGMLRAAAEQDEPRRFVVMAMRADFYAELLGDRYLRDLADGNQIPVGPMNSEQLTAAIERPARAVNAEVEPSLTEMLLHDLAADAVGAAGALPLLALALQDLWSRGRRQSMSAADYRGSGRLADIVKRTAEAAWNGLDPAWQPTARTLLTRMVSVQEGLPLTRRHLTPDQFDDFRRRDPEAEAVAARLVAARLVVRDDEGLTLVHDVLLRSWPRLLEWIEADRRRLAAHGELARSVAQWERHDRDHAYLYPERRLTAIEERLGPVPPPLAAAERAFLAGSRDRADQARLRRRILTAVLAVLLLASTAGLVTVVELHDQAQAQAATAERERREAESRLIATNADRLRQSDPGLAAQLAVAAYQKSPTEEARSALLSATATPVSTRMFGTGEAVIERIAVSPGGGLVAGAADTGDLWIWDTADPHTPALARSGLVGAEGTLRTVRFASDTRLYSAGDADTVYLHDLADPAAPRLLAAVPLSVGGVNFIEYSAAAGTIAAGGIDGSVYLWVDDPALATEPVRLEGPGGSVKAIAISPDGTRMAVATFDGRAALYDLGADVPAPQTFHEGPSSLVTIAYSPDGSMIAAGAANGSVTLWDAGGTETGYLEGPGAWAGSVAFLPGGTYVVVGAGDGLWLWNYATGALADRIPSTGPIPDVAVDPRDGSVYASYSDGGVRRWTLPGPMLTGPTGTVRNLAFIGGGPVLAVATNADSIWLWDTAKPTSGPFRELVSPDPGDRLIAGVVPSPDGSVLSIPGEQGRLWQWDTGNWDAPPVELTGLTAIPNQQSWAPGGDRIAAVDDNGWLAVWEAGGGPEPVLKERITEASAYSIAFSPTGDRLVTSTSEGLVQVWEAPSGGGLVHVADLEGPEAAVEHVAFDDSGAYIAAASSDRNAYLWPVASLGEGVPDPVVLKGNGGRVLTVAFNADPPRLAAAGLDGSVMLWDLADPADPVRYADLTGSGAGIVGAAFDGGGSMVAGGGDDPTTRLWLTDPDAAVASICGAAGAVLTAEEWELHVPGVAYRAPC